MNKAIMCAAVCGLLSSAAVAEPLTLNDNELETVNGGMISISTVNQDAFLDKFDLKFIHNQAVKPENWSTLHQKQGVKNDSDKFHKLGLLCECLFGDNNGLTNSEPGVVDNLQNFTGTQSAMVDSVGINVLGGF